MNIDHPFHFDDRGRTADTTYEDHIRDMIEQFLFTTAGERVNRSDFGSGLLAFRHAASDRPTSQRQVNPLDACWSHGSTLGQRSLHVSVGDACTRARWNHGCKIEANRLGH